MEPWVGPIAGGIGGLSMFGLRKYFQRRQIQENQLPQGTYELSSTGLHLPVYRSRGRTTLVLVGTGGLGIGAPIIDGFNRVGCLPDLGVVVVNEFDERRRITFESRLAALYPSLYQRTVFNRSTMLPGGFQGRSFDEIQSKALRGWWLPQVMETLERADKLIRGTEKTQYTDLATTQQGYDPAVILLVSSPGPHAAISIVVGTFLKEQFPLANIYVVTVLSQTSATRKEFPKFLTKLQEAQFAKHIVVGDNRVSTLAFNHAMANFYPSLWIAPLVSDSADEGHNLLHYLHTDKTLGVIVPRTYIRTIPVKHTSGKRPRFFTFQDAAIKAAMEGIQSVEAEKCKIVNLQTPREDTAKYVVVTMPIRIDHLTVIKDKVEEMLQAQGYAEQDPDRHLIWAPTTDYMGLDTDSTRVTVVKVEAAIDGLDGLSGLSQGGIKPKPPQLPDERRKQLRAIGDDEIIYKDV
jgi:hypothetical protein